MVLSRVNSVSCEDCWFRETGLLAAARSRASAQLSKSGLLYFHQSSYDPHSTVELWLYLILRASFARYKTLGDPAVFPPRVPQVFLLTNPHFGPFRSRLLLNIYYGD